MSLTPGQVAALRELSEVRPATSKVIIGATALGFYYDLTWRQTADIDLVVDTHSPQARRGVCRIGRRSRLPENAEMLRNGPDYWRREESALERRLDAFVSGMKGSDS